MLFFLSRSSRKRFCWLSFRLIIVCSIFLLIGVFVVNVLLVNQRPSVVKHDQQNAIREELVETPKFYEGHEKFPFRSQVKKKRQNLIIVAHGRSGSTFLGNIFNRHPSVFISLSLTKQLKDWYIPRHLTTKTTKIRPFDGCRAFFSATLCLLSM